ncbi:MAG: type II toxin-antitoxin system MqsA family antitoxin [Bacteroidetes bacterium]|nr:type II toxin-antitoxin system MqsA family antitoxin [Bacteroidota bacterium]MBX7046886.1 type II toxin-antitoxin system MqsA family antitoxin [Ignavibacteria bacterium]
MKKKEGRTAKEVNESIMRGLQEALEWSKNPVGNPLKMSIRSLKPVPDFKSVKVKKIRKKLALTQRRFADALGVSVKTVEAWEANRNKPNGTAQRFLYLLDKNPGLLKEIEG